MKTNEKIAINILKNEVIDLSNIQKILKNQRKTEKLVGKRLMEPWEAVFKHQTNREQLRLMYAAYGLMRGKSFSQTENKYSEEVHPLNEFKEKINKIIFEYKNKALGLELEIAKVA